MPLLIGDMGNYDAWKLATPPEYDGPLYEEDEGPDCLECLDDGWEIDADERAVPCTCCSKPITLEDLP